MLPAYMAEQFKEVYPRYHGIKYEIVEENRDLIEKTQGDLVTKAINIFGEDLVDIE